MVTYDEKKRIKNLKKHNIDLAETGEIFSYPMITKEDTSENYGEQRLQSLGLLNSKIVFMVWVDHADQPHIISVREAEKHEQKYYISNVY